ncbi:hypothetical protein [Citrobacter phage CVT22]|uniref:Uncharacterized protein n=1 Tax=Citrobacter phage CVT22 TaxID=1622234 RepID=A0A0R6C6V4_9CAUD|nr:hypothetical protein APL39_gp58 [Citrobacter phage CVT22]AJT60762.1 hypothetical protein [Citrobacter phage CVT22]
MNETIWQVKDNANHFYKIVENIDGKVVMNLCTKDLHRLEIEEEWSKSCFSIEEFMKDVNAEDGSFILYREAQPLTLENE